MIAAIRTQDVPRTVPMLLAAVAGYVDSVTFLGLFGLFVAQMTGSFVLVGTQMVEPEPGLLIKLLAIPAFFAAGCVTTLIAAIARRHALALVLALECALLTALFVAVVLGRMTSIDASPVLWATLLGIAAMGVQSAMVRLLMNGVASTNVMSTNTTQLAIDGTLVLLDRARRAAGEAMPAEIRAARTRLAGMMPIVLGFVAGTGAGALGYAMWGFISLAAPLAAAYGVLLWAIVSRPALSSLSQRERVPERSEGG